MTTIRLINPRNKPLDMWLEPLGDRVSIPANCPVELVLAKEQHMDLVELELYEDRVAVHGFVEAVVLVSSGGKRATIWPEA